MRTIRDDEDYFDIDLDLDLDGANGLLDDVFYLKDLKQRKLFLNANIDQWTVHELKKCILQYNKDDMGKPVEERKPILFYVTSNGGDVGAGFELVDVIQNSITPVYTINIGFQYSMALLVGLAGHKRFATKNSTYLMHDGSNFIFNSGAKSADQMEFNKKMESRIKKYILSRSNLTDEEYDKQYRVEWYLFADEAKEKGFVDYIIGEDCDINEII